MEGRDASRATYRRCADTACRGVSVAEESPCRDALAVEERCEAGCGTGIGLPAFLTLAINVALGRRVHDGLRGLMG